MAQGELARLLECDVKTVNRIINGRSKIKADTAIKLAAIFGTTPYVWMNAQNAIDIFEAKKAVKKLPKRYKAIA